jgi:hypothetical protein
MDENKEKAKELLVQYRRKLANIEAGFEGFGPWSDTSYDNFETLAHIIARSPEVGNNIHNMDTKLRVIHNPGVTTYPSTREQCIKPAKIGFRAIISGISLSKRKTALAHSSRVEGRSVRRRPLAAGRSGMSMNLMGCAVTGKLGGRPLRYIN